MKAVCLTVLAALLLPLSLAAGCAKQAPPVEEAKSSEAAPAPHEFDGRPAEGTQARCPVMDHEFVVMESSESSEIDGKTYVFCCPGCKEKFEADPQSYLEKM